MKNRYITYSVISFLLVMFFTNAEGQTTYKVNYKVTHDWIKKIAKIDYISQATRDKYEYMWGNNSAYEMNAVLYFNENCSAYRDIVDQSEWASNGYSYREDEYEIYRDLKASRTYDVMRVLNKLYLIDDTIHKQDWKILNDIREIAGHICMSAQYNDDLRGNKVIAWFALDIPYDVGPERFSGLPGIILEIDINDGAKVMSADTIIEVPDYKIEKPTHKKRIKRITEEDYNEIISRHIEEKKKAEQPYFYGIRY